MKTWKDHYFWYSCIHPILHVANITQKQMCDLTNKNLFQSVLQKQRNKHNIEQATKTSNHYQKNNTKRFGNVF